MATFFFDGGEIDGDVFSSSTDTERFTAFLNLFSEFWLVGPYGDQ